MTRDQRARHLLVWCLLTPAVIALLVLAAFARQHAQHNLATPPPPAATGAHS